MCLCSLIFVFAFDTGADFEAQHLNLRPNVAEASILRTDFDTSASAFVLTRRGFYNLIRLLHTSVAGEQKSYMRTR